MLWQFSAMTDDALTCRITASFKTQMLNLIQDCSLNLFLFFLIISLPLFSVVTQGIVLSACGSDFSAEYVVQIRAALCSGSHCSLLAQQPREGGVLLCLYVCLWGERLNPVNFWPDHIVYLSWWVFGPAQQRWLQKENGHGGVCMCVCVSTSAV